MKSMQFARAISVLCLLAVFGCSKETEIPPANDVEVRGRPIRGEPIKRQAAGEATASDTAPTAAAAVQKAPAPRPATTAGEYAIVSFDLLSNFNFEVPQGVIDAAVLDQSAGQIPPEVKAFDQKKVALTGFMLPLKVEAGLVTELLVMRDQSMCCYGAVPRINDWVSVKMNGKGVKPIMDVPVILFGKLHVGEMLENGYLVGIYKMDGEKMEEPKD